MKTLLFKNQSSVLFWKVDFVISKDQGLAGVGMSSVTFIINQLPKNGYCFMDRYNGTSLISQFNIKCLGWIDPDGSVERFEYMGKQIDYFIYLRGF